MSLVKTFGKILLWIAAAALIFLELCFAIILTDGVDWLAVAFMVILAVLLFFDIRALRRLNATDKKAVSILDQYQQEKEERDQAADFVPESPVPVRRLGPARVSYHALSQAEALTVQDFVVVDVETTGLNPEEDEIIEFAGIRSIGGNLEAFSTFVFPVHRIPPEITKITGIRNIDVLNAPLIKDIAPKILGFIQGLPVVAHNAPFDVKFLAAAFKKIKADIDIQYIDTVTLSRVAFPDMPNYKLATLIQELHLIDGEQQHRAGSDVKATLNLFEQCRAEIPRLVAEAERQYAQAQLEEKGYHLNQFGMQAEKDDNLEKAIRYYEDVLDEKAPLPHAYVRLAVIYKKQHRWEDVVRVCDAALAVLPGTPGKFCQPEEWEKRRAYALTKLNAEK